MASVEYEVMAKTGTYRDSDGNEKNRWLKCGVVLRSDKGLSLKLEAVPVGEFNGFFSLFEPKPRDGQRSQPERQTRQRPTSNFDDMSDDIPPF
jgi:hypothetical protein